MLISDAKMLKGSNEDTRVRQGHYEKNKSEKVEKVKGKQSWYLPKSLGESPSGPLARLKFQHVNP